MPTQGALPQTAATMIERTVVAIVTEDRMSVVRANHNAVLAEKSTTPIVLPPETQAPPRCGVANLDTGGTSIAMATGLAASKPS